MLLWLACLLYLVVYYAHAHAMFTMLACAFYWYHTYLFACMCVVMSSDPLKLRPKCETCQICGSLLKWIKDVRDVC